jgi:PPOX class probable F420-dependent enzyme
MTRTEVDAFIASAPHIGVLSTIAPDGGPHAAGMYFVPEGGGLLMWTYAKSQKSRNLARDPRAALLVEAGEPYVDLRGVLFKGRVELVTDHAEVARIGALLYERYLGPKTGLPVDEGPRGPIEQQAHKRIGIVLPTENIASWDHSKAPTRT